MNQYKKPSIWAEPVRKSDRWAFDHPVGLLLISLVSAIIGVIVTAINIKQEVWRG